ncbi:hypothetical protein ABPG72_009138 [Tetrahymena utriculariae]
MVQNMILLKSNPQNDVEDIAAVVYNPFTVCIYNFQKNIKYQSTAEADNVQFYQIDKSDRPSLKVSLIHTLDKNGRIIGWISGNGSKGDTIQIPSFVTVDPKSCLNSDELIVVSWNSSQLFIVDFSSSSILDKKIIQIKLNSTQITQCVNDKINRRFLLVDSKGVLFTYDLSNKAFSKLFQISQFSNLLSIYPTQNQIAVTYQTSGGSFYASSYKNNILQFQQSFPTISTQVLISQNEDYIVVLGQKNLFSVWSVESKTLVYQADSQNMYCDQRDANVTSINPAIDFTFGSINSKNFIAAVSNNQVFIYSLEDMKPVLFKGEMIQFSWIQAFVVQEKVVLSLTYSVSTIDIPSSKFLYLMDHFDKGQSSYDKPSQIEVDTDLNRIIKIDLAGNIQYWSLFDNIVDKSVENTVNKSTFFIDKSLNKLVFYFHLTAAQAPLINIVDYQLGILIESIISPFYESNFNLVIQQDKTNGYMIGFVIPTSQYAIKRFDQSQDHSLIFKGQLIPNGLIRNQPSIQQKAYLYSNGSFNQQVLIYGNTNPTLYYFLNDQQTTLLNVQDQNIFIYQHDGSRFNLINTINYCSGQNIQISLVKEQNTLIINRSTTLYFKNYQNLKENIFNLDQESVFSYNYDGPRGLVIVILNSFLTAVIDMNTASTLYQIKLYANSKIAQNSIYTELDMIFIAYEDGKVILYNYIKNQIFSMFDNIQLGEIEYIHKKYNTLIIKSDLQMYTKRLTNTYLMNNLITNRNLKSFWIDVKSGLSFLLSEQIAIYNQIAQQYLPNFPSSVDLTDSQIIYPIPEKNFLFLGYSNQTSNQVFVYRLDTYEQIGIMAHNVSECNTINKLYYDEYLNRLFVACLQPGTVVVWDLSNDFKLIKILYKVVGRHRITDIAFHPQIGVLMIYDWWSKSLDYYTQKYRCILMGIFGNFDYTHQLQIMWDHNGDFRIMDLNCYTLAYQQAHQNLIYKIVIDEKKHNFNNNQVSKIILSRLGVIKYTSTHSQCQLISEIKLQNSLYDGILDSDNNYLFVVDFNGFLNILQYPELTLVEQIQVTNQQIDKIVLDTKYNMLIFGSLNSATVGYYNLLELVKPNSYVNSFKYEGVMPVFNLKQGIIFHQQNNIVQIWDYESQKSNYGFYVNSKYTNLDCQSKFINIEGSDTLLAQLTHEQIIFFDVNNFDIINVQQIKCLRQTQLKNYLICSNVNTLIILDVQKFTEKQQDIFLKINNGSPNNFMSSEAIVTSLLIEQSINYIFIASGFNGQIGQFILSKQLNILSQESLSLPGTNSHAHVLYFSNDKYQKIIIFYIGYDKQDINIFAYSFAYNQYLLKRLWTYFLGLYDPDTLTLINQISSPCIGYPYKLDIYQDLDIIMQSCLGVYQINYLSTLNSVAYGRFTRSFNLNKFHYAYTPDSNEIIFVNKQYFLDVQRYQIFIYQVNQNNQTILLQGNFQHNGKELGRVVSFQIFNTLENIYIKLIIFSSDQIAQVQLPILGQNICQEQISPEQLSQVLYSIQSNLFTSFSGYNLISFNNLSIEPAKSQKEYLQYDINSSVTSIDFENLQLQQSQFNYNKDSQDIAPIYISNYINYQVLQIASENLTLYNLKLSQSNDFTNSNTHLLIKIKNQFFIDQLTISQNLGFFSLTMINVQNMGVIQNSQNYSNQAIQSLLIDQSILLISNLLLQYNQSNGKDPLNSILNVDNSQIKINNSKFKKNQSSQGGSINLFGSQLEIQQSLFSDDQSQQQDGSIYSTASNLNISQSEFINTQSVYGGSIYFEKGSLQIVQIKAQGSSSTLHGGFAYINNAPLFQIQNTTLEQTKAFGDGGSLFIYQSGGNNSFIIYSTFQNNNALGSGGIILLDNSDLQITKSSFKNKTAGVRAVIRYLNKKSSFLIQNANSQIDSCKIFGYNQCKINKAIIFGNKIVSYPRYASILPSRGFNVNITNYPNVSFSNFRSGLTNFDLSIQFLDEFKNNIKQVDLENNTLISQISPDLLQELSQYNCRLYLQVSSSLLEQQTLKIEGVSLVGVPSANSTIMLSLGGMKNLNTSNQFISADNIKIEISFRSCQAGEYYNSQCENCLLYECTQCLNGTYSLIDPKINEQISCKNCDMSETSSCLLNQIYLRENYWRVNNNSDQIFQCDLITKVCNGDESKGYCSKGQTGALCSACDTQGKIWVEQYGRISRY